jgi:predicted ATPase
MGKPISPFSRLLDDLGEIPMGKQIRTVLDRYAPTWLAQMPILLEPQELSTLLHRVQGATQPRMLREMAEALEILTAQRALMLWLEDLQWSDVSTLQLLTWLALRTGPARLYILGTFRPPEVGGPLAQMVHELHMKGSCWELSLQPLHDLAVATYLATRLGDGVPLAPQRLGRMIAQRTEGNPLFMVHIVNYLAAQGWLGGTGEPPSDAALTSLLHEVPSDIEHLIETQVAGLPPADQRLLEVASLAGADFSTAAVAAAGELAIDEVEECCAALARHGHFLQESGMDHGPDPTGATRYRFVHALYQDVLSRRVPPRRRIALHRRLGAWEEQVYDGRTAAMAAELAVRFTHAHDVRRAIGYRQQAAETAMQRSAYHEALTHITHGLDLVQELPDVTHRLHHELRLRMSLGPALIATRGYGAPEVHETYAHAQELCRQCPDSPYLFPVLFGVWGFHLVRAEYPSALTLAHQLLQVAQRVQEPGLLVEVHGAMGVTAFYLGDFVTSRAYLRQSVEAYDAAHHRGHAALYGQDPWVASRAWEGQVLWVLGYPEQALQAGREALAYAEEIAHPFSMVFALFNLALIHQFRGESAACHAQATRLVRMSEAQGFPFWARPGKMLVGWAMANQDQTTEGTQHLRDGLAMRQAMGAARPRPYFAALLAEVSGRGGNVQAGLDVVMEALETVATTGERWCEAELYRLQGELLLQAPGHGSAAATNRDAEACFQAALALARQQRAKAWELRATLSVSRLWARQGKQADARELLGAMHSAWPEAGTQTVEWQAASQLLAQLA